ncbi:MAG: hypothetical protein ACR2JC_02120 [Chloroflexota bacterium]|nr:MAG: hypothetical protein DLM70_16570 [Chloroflexota bacterium]
MEDKSLHHRPRHLDCTIGRHVEIEADIADFPDGSPSTRASCPECGSTMMYRGIGRLRAGTSVHHFECVHSHLEVHSVSIAVEG